MPDTRPDLDALRSLVREALEEPDVSWEGVADWLYEFGVRAPSPATGDSRPHSCDCEEHERTVDDLMSRLAESEGAYNEAMTRLTRVEDSRPSEGLRDAAGRSPEWYEGYQAGMRDCDKRQSARAAAAPKEEPR